MKTNFSYCPRCARIKECKFCWCDGCHKAVVAERKAREAIKPGCNGNVREEPSLLDVLKPSARVIQALAGDDIITIKAAKEVINTVARKIRCKGSMHTPCEDMSPYQEIALRCWEDG